MIASLSSRTDEPIAHRTCQRLRPNDGRSTQRCQSCSRGEASRVFEKMTSTQSSRVLGWWHAEHSYPELILHFQIQFSISDQNDKHSGGIFSLLFSLKSIGFLSLVTHSWNERSSLLFLKSLLTSSTIPCSFLNDDY